MRPRGEGRGERYLAVRCERPVRTVGYLSLLPSPCPSFSISPFSPLPLSHETISFQKVTVRSATASSLKSFIARARPAWA